MSWPYRFDFSLTAEQLAHRRYLLDSYGQLAQYSIVFPLLCFQILFVSGFLVSQAQWFKTRKEERITEPREWSSSELTVDVLSPLLRITRKIKWVLDNEILLEWGTWKQAVFAVLWGSWLLTLVIRDTGDGKSECVFSSLPLIYSLCLLGYACEDYRTARAILTFVFICEMSRLMLKYIMWFSLIF